MLSEHNQNKETELFKILNSDDSAFRVTSIHTNKDDPEKKFVSILTRHKIFSDGLKITIPIKILTLECITFQTNSAFYVILKGQWVNLPLDEGDVVQVFGKICEETRSLLITDEIEEELSCFFHRNFLIIEPSLHLTPSKIISSSPCYRKSILQDLFHQRDTLPTTKGTMMHGLWEDLLLQKEVIQGKKAEKQVDLLVQENIDALRYNNAKPEEIRQEMKEFIPSIKQWKDDHISNLKLAEPCLILIL